ncbi:MAG: hypothetical protein HQL72_13815 [Magnetococcales bacterium]|nr:hypothetical protein [Magnetococcales bacterium]
MHLDGDLILWIAWGSALIIPIKIGFLVRYIRRKMAHDAAIEQEKSTTQS